MTLQNSSEIAEMCEQVKGKQLLTGNVYYTINTVRVIVDMFL